MPWRPWRSQARLTVRSWELLSDWALASNTKLFGVGCMLQLVLYAHQSSFTKCIFLNLLKCLSRGAAAGHQIPFTALCWKPYFLLFQGRFFVVFVWTVSLDDLCSRAPGLQIVRSLDRNAALYCSLDTSEHRKENVQRCEGLKGRWRRLYWINKDGHVKSCHKVSPTDYRQSVAQNPTADPGEQLDEMGANCFRLAAAHPHYQVTNILYIHWPNVSG